MSVRRSAWAALPWLLGLGGCLLGPDAPPAPRDLPARFSEAPSEEPTPAAAGERPFWRELGDETLSRCVSQALSASPDILGATSRIRESRAIAGAAWAALLPALNGGASVERLRLSSDTPVLSEVGVQNFPGFNPNLNDWKASLSMAYELDLWGKNQRAHESAVHELAGDLERRHSIALTLAGDICGAYIDFRTLENRREIALELLGSLNLLLSIAQDRFQGGIGSELDVARAQTEIGNNQASLAELDRGMATAEHRLSVLMGSPPGSLRATLAAPHPPLRPFQLPAGFPAELLARRPDLRELSERLLAATARVGQAKADLLPQLVIQGEIGSEAVNASQMLTRGAVYWTAGPSLQIPIFDWGRRSNNWTAAEEREAQAVQNLARQVLVALQEVDDALSGAREDARRRQALDRAVEASRRASRIAEDKYRVGLISQLDVIDAVRSRLQAEDSLADAQGRVLRDAVSLGKALGGAFRELEGAMPPVAPEDSR